MAQSQLRELESGDVRSRAVKTLPVVTGRIIDPPADEGTYGPWPSGADEEIIIDAEIVDETPPRQQGFTGTQERLRDRARAFFGDKVKEQMAARERSRKAEAERAADDREGLSQRDQLLKLRAEVRLAGEAYMASLRDSKILVPGFNDEERDQEVGVMHHVYMQMMMQGCLKPLARGVSASSIVQAVGMMATMSLLSKDFRGEMGRYAGSLKTKLQERVDSRTRGAVVLAERDVARRQQLFGNVGDDALRKRLVGSTDPRDHLSRKWQRRLDDMERRERGNRDLFTPESAAMTEVALIENAFWAMREPGLNSDQVDEIYTSYRAMRKRLRGQMAEDGLERHEVVQHVRMIIGERMEYEPEMRLMFNGLTQGRIVKAPPHDARLAGSDRVCKVWRGEFDDQLGRRLPDDGMFTLRRPMNADAHQVQIAEAMRISLSDSVERDDQEALTGDIMGYVVGFSVRRDGQDTSGLPDCLQRRLDQSEAMLAGMDIDGIEPDEQQRIYSNAYVDAVQEVMKDNPDFEYRLMLTFGEEWEQTLQDAVADPARYFQEQYRFGPFASGGERSAHWTEGPTAAADAEDYQPA